MADTRVAGKWGRVNKIMGSHILYINYSAQGFFFNSGYFWLGEQLYILDGAAWF